MRIFRTVICVAAILAACVLVAGGCNDSNSPSQPPATITSYDQVLGWDCASGESCQDVFDIEFAANTTVNITAGETTGGSVLQIALYAPGTALGGTNLLTNDARELRCNYDANCSNNTAGQTVTGFMVATAGVYRLAVTRDWGSSCGASGTYRLTIDADKGFSEPVQTVDDVASAATDWGCPSQQTSFDQTFGWDCASGESCQDVFDIEFAANTTVDLTAGETTGGSVLQIALYAPGTALGGINLLTNDTRELRCNYVVGCSNNTAGQTVSGFVIPTAGVYRLAVTRDWGSSCAGSGTYRLTIDADKSFGTPVQTVDDVASAATDWGCPAEETSYDATLGWNCASGVSCQDVFDVTLTAGTTVTFEAKDTTGGSVLQIALYAPGTALGGTNLFTSTTDELRCNYVVGCSNNTAGQTVSGFAVGASGVYRLAVTRDWGSSCGGAGTYHLVITADQPIVVSQTVDDTATAASGWSCP